MGTAESLPEVKRIAPNGQISVGKASAGKLVRIEPTEDGILLRFVRDVPEKVHDQWWLHEPYKSDLKKALEWAATHPAQATDLDELEAKVKAHHAAKTGAKPRAAAGAGARAPARAPAQKASKRGGAKK